MMIPTVASTRSLFVYGTLMAPQVMQTLVGRLPVCRPATLPGYSRHPVVNCVFPGIIVASDMIPQGGQTAVQGLLYSDLTVDEMAVLDWFEDNEYTRHDVTVLLEEDEEQTTQVYVWTNPLKELDLSQPWDYELFRTQRLSHYLSHVVEPCRLEFWERSNKI